MPQKANIDSLLKGSKYCIKCNSKIPADEIGHKCQIMECPNCSKKKN
jgi:hypothetical protein